MSRVAGRRMKRSRSRDAKYGANYFRWEVLKRRTRCGGRRFAVEVDIEIWRRSQVWGKRVRRDAGCFALRRDGQQLPRGGVARAVQLKLREDVGFHGVKGGMVMLGAIWILRISLMRIVGGAMIAVVARGVLRFVGHAPSAQVVEQTEPYRRATTTKAATASFARIVAGSITEWTISSRSEGRKEVVSRESPWRSRDGQAARVRDCPQALPAQEVRQSASWYCAT